MIFLSKLILNPKNKFVHRNLANCYELHRTVLSGFPQKNNNNQGARSKFKVLYRLESDNYNEIIILIQSDIEPDWTRLRSGFLLKNSNNSQGYITKDITKMYNNLQNEMLLRFKLLANPTRKINTSTKKDRMNGKTKNNGQRVPITDEIKLIQWMTRKGVVNGFEIMSLKTPPNILNIRIRNDGMLNGIKKISQKKANNQEKNQSEHFKLSFYGVEFEGILKIINSKLFIKAMKQGIGSGKAFGFGFLTIARI